MSAEAYITIAVIVVAFVLFALDYFAVDHVAIGIMAVLAITGVLTPVEAVEGFSNTATITVAAMFVLGDALIKTGIIESVGPFFSKLLSRGYRRSVLSISSLVGAISAFVNNTPVVATFIPIISHAARETKKPASKFLIPLSFGAIFGGTCTLIGTSTNLLVDGIARDQGLEGFSMFLFAPMGLIFFIAGILYLTFLSNKFLPDRESLQEFEESDHLNNYLTEIKVIQQSEQEDDSESPADEKITLENAFGSNWDKLEVLQLKREGKRHKKPKKDFELEEEDVLLVQGNLKRIKEILQNPYLSMSERLSEREFPEEATRLVEIVILPQSRLVGRKLDNTDFFHRYRSRVLGIRQRGKQNFKDLDKVKLKEGDVLLLQTNEEGYDLLYGAEKRRTAPFLSLSESGIASINKKNMLIAGATIAAVVALASFNILPLMVAAIAAVFILVLAGITSMEDAYEAIDWKVIILLAGSLSLGAAMSKTGLSLEIALVIEEYIAVKFGPQAVIAVLYITAALLTEIITNNASAALLAPISISIASSLNLDPVPFLMAITFAGSASFLTPIGYQTNTMVYSAGNYNFKDFLKIGLPLTFLFWILASLLIPVIYPF